MISFMATPFDGFLQKLVCLQLKGKWRALLDGFFITALVFFYNFLNLVNFRKIKKRELGGLVGGVGGAGGRG